MNINLLIRGIIIGISIAAPVGPISVITIRRTLAEGRASGLASSVGAATADVIYGSIAGFGLTFISNLLIGQQLWVRLIGGLFLCYLGLKTFLLDPATQTTPVQGSGSVSGLVGAYASTFFLTLTNPMTIFTFAAVFAGLGTSETSGDYGATAVLVLGVFTGSNLWSLLLISVTSAFRTRLDAHTLQWANRISGIIIAGFGLAALFLAISKAAQAILSY